MMEHAARFGQVPLDMHSELGRCMMPVSEVLSLGPGSLIKLSSAVGSKVDLFVGGAPFGSGDMTVIGHSIGVRITNFAVRKKA
jgi:flagellar motor switch/type III secretory pathway protein FliN